MIDKERIQSRTNKTIDRSIGFIPVVSILSRIVTAYELCLQRTKVNLEKQYRGPFPDTLPKDRAVRWRI